MMSDIDSDEIKVVKVVSHLENNFQAALSDAQWYRRRRLEKKRRLEGPARKSEVLVVTLNDEDDEEVEVCLPVPKATSIEVVDVEVEEDDEVTVISNPTTEQCYMNGGTGRSTKDGSGGMAKENDLGVIGIEQLKGDVGPADLNDSGICNREEEGSGGASSTSGALLLTTPQQDSDETSTSGALLPTTPQQDSDETSTSASSQQIEEVTSVDASAPAVEEPGVDLEVISGDDKIEEQSSRDLCPPSDSAVEVSTEEGSSVPSVPVPPQTQRQQNESSDKKRRRKVPAETTSTTRHEKEEDFTVLPWSYKMPTVLKRRPKLDGCNCSKKRKLAKQKEDLNLTINEDTSSPSDPLNTSATSVSSVDSGFHSDSGQMSPYQDDVAEVGPQSPVMDSTSPSPAAERIPIPSSPVMDCGPAADKMTPVMANESDEDQMPILLPEDINELLCSAVPGIEGDHDLMPVLIAETGLEDTEGKVTGAGIQDLDLTEDASWMDTDVQEVNEQEREEVQEMVTKKQKKRRKTKENGVLILNLEEANKLFAKRVWCKVCDTFFGDIKELRSHLLVIHKINGERVTKKNEATWDMPIAHPFNNPLKL